MKKTYTKPEIAFESFTLSTNIAGDCEVINTTSSRDLCGYPTREGIIFNAGSDVCNVYPEDGLYTEGGNSFCYHTPEDSPNLFIS